MEIELIELSKIKLNDNNIKEHPEWQIEQIKNSIDRYGYNDPIAIDENNVIVEGHGRYEALMRLNYKEISVIRLKHLTEEQKRAYTLAHNKLTMNTGFEMDKLVSELSALREFGEFDFTGFSDVEFRGLERKLERTGLESDYSGDNQEIDLDGEQYSKFACTCPKCGFEFNKE